MRCNLNRAGQMLAKCQRLYISRKTINWLKGPNSKHLEKFVVTSVTTLIVLTLKPEL